MRLRLSASKGSRAEYRTVDCSRRCSPSPVTSSSSPIDLADASSVRSYATSAECSAWRYRLTVLIPTIASTGSRMPSSRRLRIESRRPEGLTRPPSRAGLEQVAEAAQGDELSAGFRESLAQAVGHDLDRFGLHLVFAGKHELRETFLRHRTAGSSEQRAQQRGLARREVEHRAAEVD